MYKILQKQMLNPTVGKIVAEAPLAARHGKPGQFVMVRATAEGERIPLTVAEFDPLADTVTLIVQVVGKTTSLLCGLEAGESISDIAGPLGEPTPLSGYSRAIVIGGGVGCAIAYPQAKALRQMGVDVTVITGFRTRDLVILEDEMRAIAGENLHVVTDDGSYGDRALVTDRLRQLLEDGRKYDVAITIGPLPMMRAVCNLTRAFNLKTIVSMNPLMIDGTGMCGCCRVTVGGKTRFACVDGPDFDGHEVDFDELTRRNRAYAEQEAQAMRDHICRLEAAGHAT